MHGGVVPAPVGARRTNDGAIEVDAFRRRNPWNRRDALYTRRGELARATGLPLIEHGEEIEASAVAWPLEVEGHVERMQSRATTR